MCTIPCLWRAKTKQQRNPQVRAKRSTSHIVWPSCNLRFIIYFTVQGSTHQVCCLYQLCVCRSNLPCDMLKCAFLRNEVECKMTFSSCWTKLTLHSLSCLHDLLYKTALRAFASKLLALKLMMEKNVLWEKYENEEFVGENISNYI